MLVEPRLFVPALARHRGEHVSPVLCRRHPLAERAADAGLQALLRRLTRSLHISRPVRLLHPRVPLYIVPWGSDTYMIGATVIELENGTRIGTPELVMMAGAVISRQ